MGIVRKPCKITVRGDTATIHLHGKRGGKAFIDAEDVPKVEGQSWSIHTSGVVVCGSGNGKRLVLPRVVLGIPSGISVEYHDGDKTNCRKENLFHIEVPRKPWGSAKGVVLLPSGKFRAFPFVDGKRTHLGTFATREEAEQAVDAATFERKRRRGIIWDATVKKYKVYSKENFLGRYDTEEEARAIRDGYEDGSWKIPKRTSGITWDSEFEKWRANGLDGKYLGRYETKHGAIIAQARYEKLRASRGQDDSSRVPVRRRRANKKSREE